MQDELSNPKAFVVRKAVFQDYGGFVRLFPELLVDDPIPSLLNWESARLASTWIAARGAEVVGYCYFQEYEDTGYVRNIVVAPHDRRNGVGQALLRATADQLRSHGKSSWRLNVKPDNYPALALYARVGMQVDYAAKSLRLPWSALPALPVASAQVQALSRERDGALELCFDLPRGQLAAARDQGRLLLEATSSTDGSPVGLAVFDPKFPGAFPFRAKEIGAATALLTTMRAQVPTDLHVNVVAEDDARLADVLESVGASVRHEILHLSAPL